MPDTTTIQQTLQQGRARFAYDCALAGKAINKSREYKSYVKKIPMMIKTNGLGAALAFVNAKKTDDSTKAGYAYKLIYGQVRDWLQHEPNGLMGDKLQVPDADLAQAVVSLYSKEYRALTNEVLAFFGWLRRFAEGLIEGEADEG